jgi:superfamily I DNA/RNA helicase
MALPATEPAVKWTWSVEQESIFEWFRDGQGNLLVRARAGCGKTTTIKAGFSHARDERMLYAVFGKRNEREAAAAITDPRVEIKTLHSLGYLFIRQIWPTAKPDNEVEMDRVRKIVGEQTPKEVKAQVLKLVKFAKNLCLGVPSMEEIMDIAEDKDIEAEQFADIENGGYDRAVLCSLALRVMDLSKEQDAEGRISFDDMVWLPCSMGWVRAWFDLVVIDESQDMNLPQLMMAKGSCKPSGRICVVGDDCQAIYEFRGAASGGMDMMQQLLNAQVKGLTVTRRCAKKIVAEAAISVPDYKAADDAPEGTLEKNVGLASVLTQLQVGDAVLSRTNAPLMPLCLSLLRKGVRARIEGKDIGKALLEIVKKLNAKSVPHFMEKLNAWREKQIARALAEAGNNTVKAEAKVEGIHDKAETLIAIAEGSSGVREIETRLNLLFKNSDEEDLPAVVLSTVHKAKGLEWTKVVLMMDTFNRKRPLSAPPLSPEAEQKAARQEANVLYVAKTRAKKHLIMATGKL